MLSRALALPHKWEADLSDDEGIASTDSLQLLLKGTRAIVRSKNTWQNDECEKLIAGILPVFRYNIESMRLSSR